MRHDVGFGLPVHHGYVMGGYVNRPHPVAGGIDNLNPYAASCRAARDQHRRQTYG